MLEDQRQMKESEARFLGHRGHATPKKKITRHHLLQIHPTPVHFFPHQTRTSSIKRAKKHGRPVAPLVSRRHVRAARRLADETARCEVSCVRKDGNKVTADVSCVTKSKYREEEEDTSKVFQSSKSCSLAMNIRKHDLVQSRSTLAKAFKTPFCSPEIPCSHPVDRADLVLSIPPRARHPDRMRPKRRPSERPSNDRPPFREDACLSTRESECRRPDPVCFVVF